MESRGSSPCSQQPATFHILTQTNPFLDFPTYFFTAILILFKDLPTSLFPSVFPTKTLYIQGDTGGICTTLGYDSMSDSKQKSSSNMGPILNGYGVKGIFNSGTRPHVKRAFKTAGVWWLTLCIASITFASWLAHSPVSLSRHLVNKGTVGWVFAWLQADAAAGYSIVWSVQ